MDVSPGTTYVIHHCTRGCQGFIQVCDACQDVVLRGAKEREAIRSGVAEVLVNMGGFVPPGLGGEPSVVEVEDLGLLGMWSLMGFLHAVDMVGLLVYLYAYLPL